MPSDAPLAGVSYVGPEVYAMVMAMERKHKYIDYPCRCPQCGYSYTVSTYEVHQVERCPVCGHGADFKAFLSGPPKPAH